jgi:site-specific DNA recombinase
MLDAIRTRNIDSQSAALKEAVIYTRVSSKDQQREGISIPAQEKLLRQYARERSLVVVAEFSDIETAGRAGRTKFGAMVRHLKEHSRCKTILVEKTDRLYRNLKDWVTLDELNLEIHMVKEGTILRKDSVSSEKLVHGIKVLMAKNYVDNLSEEVRKGMLEKAQQGQWPARAPLGYRNVTGPNGKRVIEPDPEQAPLITKLFERCAAGERSLTQLTQTAADAGLVSCRTHKRVHRSRIHAVLRNPIYMGEFNWNGVRYRGAYVPLVSREPWERVQKVLSSRATHRRNKPRRHHFTFSGLIHCGVCAEKNKNFLLVGEIKKGRYVYYHCEERKRLRRASYIREEQIVEAYTTALAESDFNAERITAIINALDESDKQCNSSPGAELALVRNELSALQRHLDVAYDDRLAGRIDSAYFNQRACVWRRQIELLCGRIKELEVRENSAAAKQAAKLELRQLHDLFRETDKPVNRRRIIETVHSNSSWKEGRLAVKWR